MNSAGTTTDRIGGKTVMLARCGGDMFLSLLTYYKLIQYFQPALQFWSLGYCGAAHLCTPATERKGPFSLNQSLHNRKVGSVS